MKSTRRTKTQRRLDRSLILSTTFSTFAKFNRAREVRISTNKTARLTKRHQTWSKPLSASSISLTRQYMISSKCASTARNKVRGMTETKLMLKKLETKSRAKKSRWEALKKWMGRPSMEDTGKSRQG